MWDFSLCLLNICLLLCFFPLFFLIIGQIFLGLSNCPLYTQQEEQSFIWEDKCSINTVAGIDQYEKGYKIYLGISAMNDKFYHPHWSLLGLMVT